MRKGILSFAGMGLVALCVLLFRPSLRQVSSTGSALPRSPEPSSSLSLTSRHPGLAAGVRAIQAKEELSQQMQMKRQLKQLTHQAYASIPTSEDLRQLSAEEVHYTPKALMTAFQKIGQVNQFTEDHPENSASSFSFYTRCMANPDFPAPVRSQCFLGLLRIAPERAKAYEGYLPTEVLELAQAYR